MKVRQAKFSNFKHLQQPDQIARPTTAQPEFTKDFYHSGLGYSKRRGVVVVDNNAVSEQSIRAPTAKE